jgi:hypothetical protein
MVQSKSPALQTTKFTFMAITTQLAFKCTCGKRMQVKKSCKLACGVEARRPMTHGRNNKGYVHMAIQFRIPPVVQFFVVVLVIVLP